MPVPAAIMTTLRCAGGGLSLSRRKGPCSCTVELSGSLFGITTGKWKGTGDGGERAVLEETYQISFGSLAGGRGCEVNLCGSSSLCIKAEEPPGAWVNSGWSGWPGSSKPRLFAFAHCTASLVSCSACPGVHSLRAFYRPPYSYFRNQDTHVGEFL